MLARRARRPGTTAGRRPVADSAPAGITRGALLLRIEGLALDSRIDRRLNGRRQRACGLSPFAAREFFSRAEYRQRPACSLMTGESGQRRPGALDKGAADRKSTRLNSSHHSISYAVFCLKK